MDEKERERVHSEREVPNFNFAYFLLLPQETSLTDDFDLQLAP